MTMLESGAKCSERPMVRCPRGSRTIQLTNSRVAQQIGQSTTPLAWMSRCVFLESRRMRSQ